MQFTHLQLRNIHINLGVASAKINPLGGVIDNSCYGEQLRFHMCYVVLTNEEIL